MTSHVDDQLSAYLDEELDGVTRRRISAHLEGCDRCSTHLAELAALDGLSRGEEIEAPDGYLDALPGEVRKRLPDRVAPTWVVPRWTWAAAAAVLLAVLAPLTLEQGADIRPAEQSSRPAVPRPAAAPATLAKEDDSREPLRQLQALDEAVAGVAGDGKTEVRERESNAPVRKDALESQLEVAAPAAPPPPRPPLSNPHRSARSVKSPPGSALQPLRPHPPPPSL